MNAQPQSVYDAVGGSGWFVALVERFYESVNTDSVLRPLYPEDLAESRRTLTGFLIQYWGGPTDYSAERGHPRLRMRHNPFVIGHPERDAWARHMADAVRAGAAPVEVETAMLEYFENAATAMMNAPERA